MGRRFAWTRAALVAVAVGGTCAFAWAGDDPPPPPPPAPPTADEPPAPAPEPPPAAPKADEPPAVPAPAPDAKTPADEPPKEAPKDEPKKEEVKAEEPKKEEAPVPPPAPPEATTLCLPPAPVCWRGSVALKYRGRTAGSEHDNDLYAYLTLRYGDEGANGWSSSVHGKLAYDLDGGQNPSAFFPFASIDDTFHGPLTGRLYHAWANWHEEGAPIENVRIGRQWTETGDGFLFDGVHVTFAPSCYANAPCGSGPCSSDKNVRLSVFGGVPAHLFEDSPEGDWIVGAGISGNPWWGAEARADVVHVEDKNDFYGKPNPTIAYAEIRQRFGNACTGRAWYSQLNEEPRRWGVSFDTYAAPWDASFRGRFESQMLREKQTAYDIDPYFAILETLQPYWDLHLSASKGVGDHVIVEAGGDARRLWRESDQGTFNREFDRGFVTLSTVDWPSCGVGLYVTGEVWDSEGQRLKDVEGGLDWKPSRCWRFSAGTDYALWRTDLFATAERFDSRGYYIRVVHTPSELWRFDLSLRYEHDSLDDYWTVQAGVRRSF